MQPPGRKNNLLFSLGLALIGFGISFFVLEGFSRIYYYEVFKKPLLAKYEGKDLCIQYDKDLLYKFIPNRCCRNSRGYFDYEYSYNKPDGCIRIVVIGDSIAQGQGVGLNQRFPKILEEKLNSGLAAKKFEVITLACSGYSTSQEIILLKKEALLYNPDLIIWSYCLNDPAHPVFHNANGETGRYFFKTSLYSVFLIRRSIFLFIENEKAKKYKTEDFDARLHDIYWGQVEKDIAEIAKVSSAKKMPVIFLIHPDFIAGKGFDQYPFTELHKKLYTAALKSNLYPIDLLDCYRQYEPHEIKSNDAKWFDPWHLSAKGHAAIAGFIEKRVRDLLPSGN